jgi:tRNA nucleotidyltransferase (CCA-adding enzyme)
MKSKLFEMLLKETQNNMKESATLIIQKLSDAGFEAYFVGGAVRDFLLGKEPKDYDIVTSATPPEIRRVFQGFQIIEVGANFGIVVVVINGEPFEIATFRQDGTSSDSRHPDQVQFVKNIEDDLSRRDLTMNSVATKDFKTFVDPFNGRGDIKKGIIRFVGDPEERLEEDNLRAIRAVRFQAQLGLKLSDDVIEALKDCPLKVSAERIQAEFKKILLGNFALDAIDNLRKTGMLWTIFPEMKSMLEPHNNKWHTESDDTGNSIWAHVRMVFKYACEESKDLPKDDKIKVRLAALFHDIGKSSVRSKKEDGTDRFLGHDKKGEEMTREILTRLKFESAIINDVSELVGLHMDVHNVGKIRDVAKIRLFMGKRLFPLAEILGSADEKATINSMDVAGKDHVDLHAVAKKYRDLYPNGNPDALVKGDDLIKIGMKPGPVFKGVLDKVYRDQLRGIEDKDKLLKNAKGYEKMLISNQEGK